MSEVFVTKIHINKVRHLENFEIPLSEDKKKHLIITGKNGSGKTSVLEEIREFLLNAQTFPKNIPQEVELAYKLSEDLVSSGEMLEAYVNNLDGSFSKGFSEGFEKSEHLVNAFDQLVRISFNTNRYVRRVMFEFENYITAYFSARRPSDQKDFIHPEGPKRIRFKDKYDIKENIGEYFIQYMVNQKATGSLARDKGLLEKTEQINQWFENFQCTLAEIFDDPTLKLDFDIENFNFSIIQSDKEPFGFNELSDGYSAFINILAELIMRMEKHKTSAYDLQGVVLIDEIETHLHVDLQKKVLPFLTKFFPNIQFIVTTHSPFVLSSIEDSVICDLENKTVAEDFSGYSYSAIVKAYFEADEYSRGLKDKIVRYKTLKEMKKLSDDEEDELLDLEDYLENLPKFSAPELELEVNRLLEDK